MTLRLLLIPLVLGFVLLAPPAAASDGPALVPVVSGKPGAPDAELVVLCPDIGERPEIFQARDDDGLALGLARAGYRVLLVDPWNTSEAGERGFDAVVSDVFPDILARVESRAAGAPVTWIGHGLCGLLPVAAAASPRGTALAYRWVALGTRFDYRHLAPRYRSWLETFADGIQPLPEVVMDVLATGLRPGVGARVGSLPESMPQGGDLAKTLQLAYNRSWFREPPEAVVEDLLRWSASGGLPSRQGWVDYRDGLQSIATPGFVAAGMSDPVAPPEDALVAVDAIGDRIPVTWHLLSRGSGHTEEYGHLGMLVSRHAARDVDAAILRWLKGE